MSGDSKLKCVSPIRSLFSPELQICKQSFTLELQRSEFVQCCPLCNSVCTKPDDAHLKACVSSGLCAMALVIGIVSTKGGSGKTTMAINLARAIQLDGYDVQVIDTDPKRTAARWGELQPEGYHVPVRHVDDTSSAVSFQSRLMLLEEEAEVSVIDGPTKSDGTIETLVRASHAVLIPVQTHVDISAVRPVVQIVRRTSTLAAFVVTRQIVGANLADKIADSLREHDLPVFENRVYQRVAYAETLLEGISVTDRPGAVKARKEVEGIAGELTSLLRRQRESDEQSQYDR